MSWVSPYKFNNQTRLPSKCYELWSKPHKATQSHHSYTLCWIKVVNLPDKQTQTRQQQTTNKQKLSLEGLKYILYNTNSILKQLAHKGVKTHMSFQSNMNIKLSSSLVNACINVHIWQSCTAWLSYPNKYHTSLPAPPPPPHTQKKVPELFLMQIIYLCVQCHFWNSLLQRWHSLWCWGQKIHLCYCF